MLDPTSTETWIKAGTASVSLVTALVALIVVWQGRRKDQESSEPALEPTSITGLHEAPEPLAYEMAVPDEPVLPGRPLFINRDREMKDLISRVQAGQETVLTIEGNRWVGKSAAATELVHCLRSGPARGSFDPRGRRFVWLDAHDGCPSLADVCQRVSLQTDVPSLTATAEAGQREMLREHLARTRTVLVLDNLSLADDPDSHVLIDFLNEIPNGSLVIASLNRRGGLVASRVPLPDLDADSVHKLIADRARRLNLDGIEQFDRAFAVRLHGLIGGNPGVIEWFLRGYRDSAEPLESLVAAIEKGGELSGVFGPTWEGLADHCKCALEGCAYLGGEATAKQLAIACDRPEGEMLAATEALRQEGLLTPVRGKDRPTVYTCARAFQLFVESKTPDETRTAIPKRLADHYIDHFTAKPEDAHYGAGEVGALRVVRNAMFDAGDDDRVQALFRAVLDILFTLGQFKELIDTAAQAFESARRADRHSDAALAGAIKAGTHAIRGEHALALAAYAHASLAAASSGLPGPIACVKRCEGFVHYRSRKARSALLAIKGAEEMAREAKDGVVLVDTLDLRTAANWYLRRFDACEAAAKASLAAGEAMDWKRARAYPLRYQAELAIQRRQTGLARELLDEASDVAMRFRDRRQLARVELTRARMCLLEGELDRGESAVTRAVSESQRLGLPPEFEEAVALANAIGRAQRSRLWRWVYALWRPTRLTRAPVGGD